MVRHSTKPAAATAAAATTKRGAGGAKATTSTVPKRRRAFGGYVAGNLPKEAINRLARRAQLGSINEHVHKHGNDVADNEVRQILREACLLAEHARRKTVLQEDMRRAVQRVTGHTVLGDVDLRGASKLKLSKAKKE